MLPSDLFPNISVETVDTVKGVFIPLTDLAGLTEAEAHPDTGNGGELLRVITTTAYDNYNTLPTKPTKTEISYQEAVVGANRRRQDVSLSFFVSVPTSSYQIETEPV